MQPHRPGASNPGGTGPPLAGAAGSVIIPLAMESHERDGFILMMGYVVLLLLILAMGVLTHLLITP